MSLWQELSNIPNKCIYGIFNDVDKKVYIGYSSNTIRTIYSNMSTLVYSNMSSDWDKLDFRIIEIIDDPARLKIRYQYWVSDYSNKGWTMYRDYKAVEYKVSIDIKNDPSLVSGSKYLLYVKLVSRGYKELIVGVFDDLDKCNEFVSLHYSNIHDIIYCDNELTQKYRKSLK